MASLPSPDRVPVEAIAPLIRRWLAEYRAGLGDPGPSNFTYVEKSGGEGHLEVLSFQCKVSGRVLRRILKNKVQGGRGDRKFFVDTISFDTADKIVTAIDHTLWYREPLNEFYGPLEVTYAELKAGYELPEGFDWDALPTAKKYLWSNARLQNARMKAAA